MRPPCLPTAPGTRRRRSPKPIRLPHTPPPLTDEDAIPDTGPTGPRGPRHERTIVVEEPRRPGSAPDHLPGAPTSPGVRF